MRSSHVYMYIHVYIHVMNVGIICVYTAVGARVPGIICVYVCEHVCDRDTSMRHVCVCEV